MSYRPYCSRVLAHRSATHLPHTWLIVAANGFLELWLSPALLGMRRSLYGRHGCKGLGTMLRMGVYMVLLSEVAEPQDCHRIFSTYGVCAISSTRKWEDNMASPNNTVDTSDAR